MSAQPIFGRVALVGVGLIGGSIGAVLCQRRLAIRVVGWATRDLDRAVSLQLIDEAAESAEAAIRGADLVVLAAPVDANRDLLGRLGAWCKPGVVITDVSSTKRSVLEAAAGLGALQRRFVAAHPIAGGERGGADAARIDLFEGCASLICADAAAGTDADAIERVAELWTLLGARVVQMPAERHDALFARVSHWPHAVAFALAASVGNSELAEEALRFAGGGLRDTTRIGASSPAMWADILLDNRSDALSAAGEFAAELDAVRDALQDGDRERLVALFTRGADWRRRL